MSSNNYPTSIHTMPIIPILQSQHYPYSPVILILILPTLSISTYYPIISLLPTLPLAILNLLFLSANYPTSVHISPNYSYFLITNSYPHLNNVPLSLSFHYQHYPLFTNCLCPPLASTLLHIHILSTLSLSKQYLLSLSSQYQQYPLIHIILTIPIHIILIH